MESEFVTLELAGSEAEWLKQKLTDIPLGMQPTPSMSMLGIIDLSCYDGYPLYEKYRVMFLRVFLYDPKED